MNRGGGGMGCLGFILVIGAIMLVVEGIGGLFDGGEEQAPEPATTEAAATTTAPPEPEPEESPPPDEDAGLAKDAERELRRLGGWERWSVRKVEADGIGGVEVFTELYPKPSNEAAATGICTTLKEPIGNFKVDSVLVWGFDGQDLQEIESPVCGFGGIYD